MSPNCRHQWEGIRCRDGRRAAAHGGTQGWPLHFAAFSPRVGADSDQRQLHWHFGAGVGLPAVFFCMAGIAFFGGVHAIISLIWKGELIYTLKRMGRRFARNRDAGDNRPGQTIPYALAITVGSVWGVMWQIHLKSMDVAAGSFG